MIGLATVRARGVTLLDVHNAGAGGLLFRFHNTIGRIATRFGRDVALRWVQALVQYQGTIDLGRLQAAIASGNLQVVEAAVDAHAMQQVLQRTMRDPLFRTAGASGSTAAAALSSQGISASFNAIHPNVILYAQTRAAALVTSVPDDVRETIRLVTALGASGRATIDEQARMLKEVVGLPRNQALAPLRFGDELRAAAVSGQIGTLGRRLSGADMLQIRAAIEGGTMTPAAIAEWQAVYAQRLIALRAETIARTESLAAANFGVHEAWKQAVQAGDLPAAAKRFWIVTPDDRLCPICVEIPGMNPDGVGIDEPFDTPDGPVMDPPAPHPNCRCATGLVLPDATALPTEEQPPPPDETPLSSVPLEDTQAARALDKMVAAADISYTSAQVGILGDYQGASYYRINGYLRGDRTVRQDAATAARAKKSIATIDGAFARTAPTTAPLVVWRGAELNAAPRVGAIMIDKAFISTSVLEQTALSFARDADPARRYVIRAVVPKGTRALWMDAITGKDMRESELLLNRSSRFRVTSVTTMTKGGSGAARQTYRVINVELLPYTGAPALPGARP